MGWRAQGPSMGTPQPPPSWTQPHGGCPTSGHLAPLQQNLLHIEAVKGPPDSRVTIAQGGRRLRGCIPQPCLWLLDSGSFKCCFPLWPFSLEPPRRAEGGVRPHVCVCHVRAHHMCPGCPGPLQRGHETTSSQHLPS